MAKSTKMWMKATIILIVVNGFNVFLIMNLPFLFKVLPFLSSLVLFLIYIGYMMIVMAEAFGEGIENGVNKWKEGFSRDLKEMFND